MHIQFDNTSWWGKKTTAAITRFLYKLVKGALQLMINRYGKIRFAHVHERVSTKSFFVLIRGISKSNHLGAQSTFNRRSDTELGNTQSAL